MVREIELIRKLLLEAEKKKSPSGFIIPVLSGYTQDQIAYHIMLLADAGYIDAIDLTTKDGYSYAIVNLTWEGHEFLDASRDDTIWNKVINHLGPKVSSVGFDVIKKLLISFLTQQFGL